MKNLYILLISLFLLGSFSFSFGKGNIRDYSNPNNDCFIENKGQWQIDANFVASAPGVNIAVKSGKIFYDFYKKTENSISGQVISMSFVNSTSVSLIPVDELPGTYNYFIGSNPSRWITDTKSYSRLLFRNICNGIDVELKFDSGQPRYDFILHPGANPDDLKLEFTGAEKVRLDNERGIIFSTQIGDIINGRLLAYQEETIGKKAVPCNFKLNDDGTVQFVLDDFDRSKPLIIDPVVFSTFIGGNSADDVTDIAAGKDNQIAICGWTSSPDYKVSVGAYTTNYKGSKDVCISKYKMDGLNRSLVFSSIIGGSMSDEAVSVSIDPDSNIVVAGITNSGDYPKKNGIYGYNKDYDVFVTKLNSNGNDLLYSTFIGGNKDDILKEMKTSNEGEVYLTGYTNSTNFPLVSPQQNTLKGPCDIFFTMLRKSGNSIDYSTYFGGTSEDKGYALDVDDEGNAYITGSTSSGDFPIIPFEIWGTWITKQPYDYSYNGMLDAFVLKIFKGGSIDYSTYFGGQQNDVGKAIAVDLDGSVFLAGETYKEVGSVQFPLTEGAYQSQVAGGSDGFYAKLDNLKYTSYYGYNYISQPIVFSTFFGKTGDETIEDMVYNRQTSAIYIVGSTSSSNYPQEGSDHLTFGGKIDGFITRFNKLGTEASFSTTIGGKDDDKVESIALDSHEDIYFCGSTKSSDFKLFSNPFQPKYAGGETDGFFAKYAPGKLNITNPTSVDEFCPGKTINIKWISEEISDVDKFTIEFSKLSDSLNWKLITNGATGTSYNWTLPKDIEPGNDYFIRIYTIAGISYTIPSSFTINSKPVINTVNVKPESLTPCEGDELRIAANVSGRHLIFKWRYNGSVIQGAGDSVLIIKGMKPINSGAYDLLVDGACEPSVTSQAFNIEVKPLTKVHTVLNDTTVKSGSDVNFNLDVSGTGLNYEWQQNGVKINSSTNPVLSLKNVKIDNEGSYRCIIRSDCGIDTTKSFFLKIDSTTSIPDNPIYSDKLKIEMWQNNSTGNIHIIAKSSVDCFLSLKLLDNTGRIIRNLYNCNLSQGISEYDFDSSDLSSGIYWIAAVCGDEKSIYKLSIIK